MATIAESVQQVGDIINQISSASAEQASGLEEVSEAMIDAIFSPLPADRSWTPLPDFADA